MASWVAIDVNIASDPAVHRIAAALKIRVPEAVGLLALTFAGVGQHAPDGQLAAVPDSLLETWASWHGKRGAFAPLFRAELCDETGLITAWEKYNGANLRRLDAARERTRLWREEQAAIRAAKANGTHTRTHTAKRTRTHSVREPYARTEQDRTEQTHLTTTAGGADAPRRHDLGQLRGQWMRRVGAISAKAITRELGTHLETHGLDVLLVAIDAYAEQRIAASQPLKLEWFSAEIVSWIERSAPVVDRETGLPNARGMAVLAGAKS